MSRHVLLGVSSLLLLSVRIEALPALPVSKSLILAEDDCPDGEVCTDTACVPGGHLEIPSGTTHIKHMQYLGCESTSLTIADTVTQMGTLAFGRMAYLTTVSLPSGPMRPRLIWEHSQFGFAKKLQSLVFPDAWTEVLNGFCQNCYELAHVTFGPNLKSIFNNAFENDAALTHITLPASLEKISIHAFQNTYLEAVCFEGNEEDVDIPSWSQPDFMDASRSCPSPPPPPPKTCEPVSGKEEVSSCYALPEGTQCEDFYHIQKKTKKGRNQGDVMRCGSAGDKCRAYHEPFPPC